MKKVSLLAALLASLAAPVNSQQTAPAKTRAPQSQASQSHASQSRSSKDEPVRISVTLVQVDAVVNDAKGRLVTDLKPGDFEILEDGRAQKITNFSYISTESPQPEPKATPRPDKSAPPLPPVALRPDQVRRTIAVVVDDLTMSFESIAYARDALRKFVDQQIEPGDLVAIIRSGAGIGALQQFTTDKRQLYAAIESLRWNPQGTGGISAFQPIAADPRMMNSRMSPGPGRGSSSVGQADAAGARGAGARGQSADSSRFGPQDEIDEFRHQMFAVGTLGAVGYVVRGLQELPGRKSVVLVSDGVMMFNRNEPNDPVIQGLRFLTDMANRASVVIYCLDARGLATLGMSAADDLSGLSTQDVMDRLQGRRVDFYNSQAGLIYLARTTGGFAVTNSNDLAGGIRKVLDDQKGYYLIGYVPDESTFKPVAGRRVFHRVDVKVKRAGLRVRSRTGFYGAEDEQTRPAAKTREEQLTAAVTSPFAAGDIDLKLTTMFGNSPKTSFVQSLLYIDPQNLTFEPAADGNEKAVLDVVAITFGENGRIVDQTSRTDTVTVKKEAHKRVLDHGLLYGLVLPIKKPGAYQLRVAVRDAASSRVGSANQFVAVPDLTKGRLTMSGMVLSGRQASGQEAASAAQARGTRGASSQEGTARPDGSTKAGSGGAKDGGGQVDPGQVEGAQVDDNVEKTGPGLRLFRRGRDLDLEYTVSVYNAHVDKATGEPRLESQIRLFKDGNEVYASPLAPMKLSPAHHDDWKRIAIGGTMHLTHSQEPGHYVLQMVVVDKLAKEKYGTATQWMDFEVVE
jgi:VWFA-related protein